MGRVGAGLGGWRELQGGMGGLGWGALPPPPPLLLRRVEESLEMLWVTRALAHQACMSSG